MVASGLAHMQHACSSPSDLTGIEKIGIIEEIWLLASVIFVRGKNRTKPAALLLRSFRALNASVIAN